MASQQPLDSHALQTLARLAEALDTTAEELMLHAPHAWRAQSEGGPELQELDEAECRAYLLSGVVGRLAFASPSGPAILPVTYAVAAGRVIFRTSTSSPLARVIGERVAFEVDEVDPVRRAGWSVVVAGVAHAVIGPVVDAVGEPRVDPWPGGSRDLYVVIDAARITGRRIRARAAV
jgi:hypothetical protein